MISLVSLMAVAFLGSCHVGTEASVGRELDNELTEITKKMMQLTRQMIADTTAREERVRSDGDSGLKQIRLYRYGYRPYHSESYSRRAFASIHDHSNNIRTVGMGEVVAVINGVEFRTRHNDYRLNMPSRSSMAYHATEPIAFPPVPREVTNQRTIAGQIAEMQEYFRAWKTQNETHRNYTEFFKPLLCYMEGAWTKGKDRIDEPFFSDRHYIRAKTWLELLQKIRMTSYTGSKDNRENYAFLPTKIMYLKGEEPVFAQWNYRILCHPLKQAVPFDAFHVVDDVSSRMATSFDLERHTKSRAARFVLRAKGESASYRRGFLDKLMEEIPGKNNYLANITMNMDSLPVLDVDSDTPKNVGYYHRVFRVSKKGAMGTSVISRGFNDASLFVAMTNHTEVAPMEREICRWYKSKWRCYTKSARASWAFPLEIIYMTPLSSWNPYNLEYKGSSKSEKGKTVYGYKWKRYGGRTKATAYNGTNSKTYFRTPAEFFGGRVSGSPADTSRYQIGVLDRRGNLKLTRASGIRIFFPRIGDLGSIRQRYPIAPVHDEGSSTRKELEGLKDKIAKSDAIRSKEYANIMSLLRDGVGGKGSNEDRSRILVVQISPSRSRRVQIHTHIIELTADDIYDLRIAKKTIKKITSRENGHEHTVVLKARYNNFIMTSCDGKPVCWDYHPTYMTVRKV